MFISGVTGTGMGPLALMAKAAGIEVFGTDLHKGLVYDELVKAGIEVLVGPESQEGAFLREKLDEGVEWFVYTSALPEDHAELTTARAAGVKCTKRDDFTAFLVEKLGLKMVAVAGTHGKTTTTAMIIWAALKLGLPAAYIVGTVLGFAPAGAYHESDKYFVYEADEYDRNFLKFRPWLAVIPAVSYDHPDIYPTREDYEAAFRQFEGQSERVVRGSDELEFRSEDFQLAGEVRREDAALAATAVVAMLEQMRDSESDGAAMKVTKEEIVAILDEFPGVGRRFERLAEGIYTDYAHHPEEIMATVEMAKEEVQRRGFSGVTVIYEPHQNSRQHEVREGYREVFAGVERLLWLPTFLTREDPTLTVLTPTDLIGGLTNKEVAEAVEMNDELFEQILAEREKGRLVVLMTAGPADGWLREKVKKS